MIIGLATPVVQCMFGNRNERTLSKSVNVFFIIPFTKKTEMQNTGPNSRTTTAQMALAIRAR